MKEEKKIRGKNFTQFFGKCGRFRWTISEQWIVNGHLSDVI